VGIHFATVKSQWIPAFAGMTKYEVAGMTKYEVAGMTKFEVAGMTKFGIAEMTLNDRRAMDEHRAPSNNATLNTSHPP
jgi:hypothetical protein